MTAQYWTLTGYDIWQMDEVTVKRLTNLSTKEVLSFNSMTEVNEHKFVAVHMPKIKHRTRNLAPDDKEKVTKSKKKMKSKYKGVSRLGKKWRAQVYDKKLKKSVHLGTYDSDLLAAAAYQEYIGNDEEAWRLRMEFENKKKKVTEKPAEVQGGMRPGDFEGA